ncbi:SDR family NAD(P)-dependent oxidoreductase [Deinococcus taklimakanensis]|uniref:SDR family NAD(P)-dependent oxidoreductase n=1 Tax=Deinococcus taklimakanensis TaxID=536443 RepID=A0ABW5P7D9_9DEIO
MAGKLDHQVAVITGGSGVLGRGMALALAEDGAMVFVGGMQEQSAAQAIEAVLQGHAQAARLREKLHPLSMNVLDAVSLDAAAEIVAQAGGCDILINAAGGNRPAASVGPEQSFFDLDLNAVDEVIRLNLTGTFAATQTFSRAMVERQRGCIVNIASMAGLRPLTRVVGYSASKAAMLNFTQWLAVEFAQKYGEGLRVNAISPGFFLTEQNRYLMLDENGEPTARARSILAHTPQGRFGVPEDLISTLRWLLSPESRFVTGANIPVDGGFSAFGGV